jgi:hypothetical protein
MPAIVKILIFGGLHPPTSMHEILRKGREGLPFLIHLGKVCKNLAETFSFVSWAGENTTKVK